MRSVQKRVQTVNRQKNIYTKYRSMALSHARKCYKQTTFMLRLRLSSRRLLANVKYYQADVCWKIWNTIKPTTLI